MEKRGYVKDTERIEAIAKIRAAATPEKIALNVRKIKANHKSTILKLAEKHKIDPEDIVAILAHQLLFLENAMVVSIEEKKLRRFRIDGVGVLVPTKNLIRLVENGNS